jgi:4-hydroxybenzoate polyprenyltransferase
LFAGAVIEALIDGSILSLMIALGAAWAMGWHMTWQLSKLDIDDPDNCLMLFRANRDTGLLAALFLAISVFV